MAYNPLFNPHPVTGPLTDVQLRASTVAVSGTTPTDALANASVPASGMMGFSGGSWDRIRTVGAVADATNAAAAMLANGNFVFNGTTWDRMRGTTSGISVLPVVLANASVVNRSGAITIGGTAQTLAAANTARTGLTVQNLDATLDLYLTEDGVTTAALGVHYKIAAGAVARVNTAKVISVWGSTTGQKFAATEF